MNKEEWADFESIAHMCYHGDFNSINVVPSSSLAQDNCLSSSRHGFKSRWDRLAVLNSVRGIGEGAARPFG